MFSGELQQQATRFFFLLRPIHDQPGGDTLRINGKCFPLLATFPIRVSYFSSSLYHPQKKKPSVTGSFNLPLLNTSLPLGCEHCLKRYTYTHLATKSSGVHCEKSAPAMAALLAGVSRVMGSIPTTVVSLGSPLPCCDRLWTSW